MYYTATIERPITTTGSGRLVRQAIQRFVDAMCGAWHMARMHPRTRYLSQARDHVELEARMRAWDE